jgi:hypothetical protein
VDISNDLGQLSRVDVIEITENIDVSWCAVMDSHQGGVMLQRLLIVGDAYVASLVEVRDVELVFVPVGIDDAIGGEGRRTAMRMVDDDDILDPNRCWATEMERSASTARPPATITGKMVVDDATRLPAASRTISPGNTSSPSRFAIAFGTSAALGS